MESTIEELEAYLEKWRVTYQLYWMLFSWAVNADPIDGELKNHVFIQWIQTKHRRFMEAHAIAIYSRFYQEKFVPWLKAEAHKEHERGEAVKRYPFDIETRQDNPEYGTISITARGYCTKDTPGTMYARNGDPGDPPEAGETIYLEVGASNEDGIDLYDHSRKENKINLDWEDLDEKAYENAMR